METTFHVHAFIIDFLKVEEDMTGWFTGSAGRPLTDLEVRHSLKQMYNSGLRIIPSNGCDNYDKTTGCLGHPKN